METVTTAIPELELSDEQSRAWWILTDPEFRHINRIIFGGGAGGGKSTIISLWSDTMCRMYPGVRGYLGRETLKDIKESVLLTFFEVTKKTNNLYRYREDKSKITYYNGSEIFLLETFAYPSDPNFDRFGSREYTFGSIEEGVTTSKRASDLLISRTRYLHKEFNLFPKQLITLNPGDGWIKDDIVTPQLETGRPKKASDYFVPASLDSNPDKEFAKRYRNTLEATLNDFDLARLLEGNWDARPKTGAEYLKEFDSSRHVQKTKYDPLIALHVTFDENVHPYITALIFQIQKEGSVRHAVQIAEVCQSPPNNSRKKVCETICEKYRFHTGGMFIYGDATSKKNDTAKEYGENFFTDILFYLKQFKPVLRVPNANPPVMSKGGFMNAILQRTFREIRWIVDPICKNSISDYSFTLEDANGGVLKKKILNPDLGISYEKHGHHVDAASYFFCEAFLPDFNFYLTGGVLPKYHVGSDRAEKFER